MIGVSLSKPQNYVNGRFVYLWKYFLKCCHGNHMKIYHLHKPAGIKLVVFRDHFHPPFYYRRRRWSVSHLYFPWH